MPRLLIKQPETYESTTRPVIFDITRQIVERTGIPKDVRLFYPGDIEKGIQNGSSITTSHPEQTKLPFTSQITIEATEDYQEDRMLSSAVFRDEYPYIFLDRRLGVGIKPVYAACDVTLNFKYRARSKQQAVRWRDEIKNRTGLGRELFVHKVDYHFLFPEETLFLLREIHRLRESVAGYGDSFDNYFKCHRTQKSRFLTNQAGQNGRWGVAESQARVLGWFDFEGAPEQGSKEDDASTWTISFAYKFKYDKVTQCAMQYPLVVHNQMIKYHPQYPEQPMYEVENDKRQYALSAKMFSYFETGTVMHYQKRRQGYLIPSFDEFLPSSIIPSTLNLCTLLIKIDPNNPRMLFNFMDKLGNDLLIDPDMKCCLEREQPYMQYPFKSIFSLSLYRGTTLEMPDKIFVDTNLNVMTTFDMDLRQTYHVRIALVYNLRLLPGAVLDRLRQCAQCLIKLLDAIDPSLKGKDLLPCIVNDTMVSPQCLALAINAMAGSSQTGQNIPPTGWNVETLFVQANRASDLGKTTDYPSGLTPDNGDDGCEC